ncbi:MAG TPA: MFS transporter [Candidatus Binatia bacterium]|nr:MFS transporter [Candidatus Binatia bacterium]
MRREESRVLLVVCLGTFFHIQSVGSISVSLSAIQKEFDASLAAVQWIGLMGAIMLSSLSLFFGRAGDLVGRNAFFKIGLALYTAGAGLAAVSGSFPQLLAFRCLMALGLAMAAPLAAAIIASVHAHESRGRALGLLAASIALGRTTGPTIGGFILQLWGWRAVFLANCVFGIATCLTLLLVLKGREERRKASFDMVGVFSLVIGFPSFLIALSLGPRLGWHASEIMLWLGLAAAGIAIFIWRELHAEAPLMNLLYFRSLPLFRSLLSLIFATLAFYPVSIFGPLYLLNVIQASPFSTGFAMATLPLCTTLFSPLSGRLADRLNPRWVALFGLCTILLGVFFYARLGEGSTLIWIVFVLSILGTGIGLFVPANEKAAFSTVPSRDYGMLSAMLTAFATGAGVLGTIVAVALADMSNKSRIGGDGAGFAYDQQFAFTSLLPLAALAVLVTMVGKRD